MKRLVHLTVLIATIVWLWGCEPQPAMTPSGRTIKVGIIAPFSGPVLAYGADGLKGIRTVMHLQPYLRNGDRIELVEADDQNDPARSVALLERLVVEDNVAAIITFSSSGPVLAMAEVADAYKTPIIAAAATHPDVTRHNNFVSQLGFDDNFQGIVAALFVRDDLMIDKVAVFNNADSAYSRHLAFEFEHKFKSIGGVITDSVTLTDETIDLAKIVSEIYVHEPELIYLPIDVEDVIRVVKEVRKLGWSPKMMGSDGLIATMLIQYEAEIDLVDGMLATDFFAHEMPLTPFGKRARNHYRDHYGETATAYAALGVEGYAILLNAMNRCSDPADRECVNTQIRSTDNFTGIVGRISIGPNGKTQRPLTINAIQNRRSKFIFKVY